MKLVDVYGEMIERNAAKPNFVSETGVKGEQRDVGMHRSMASTLEGTCAFFTE